MLCGDWFSCKKPFTNSSQNCHLLWVIQSDFFWRMVCCRHGRFSKKQFLWFSINILSWQRRIRWSVSLNWLSFVFTTQTTFHYPCWRSLAAQRLLVIWIFRYIFPTNRSPQAWTPWNFWIFWNASKCRRIKGISSVVFA